MFSGIFFHGLVFEAESEPSLVLILKRFDQFDENGVGQSFRIALIRLAKFELTRIKLLKI